MQSPSANESAEGEALLLIGDATDARISEGLSDRDMAASAGAAGSASDDAFNAEANASQHINVKETNLFVAGLPPGTDDDRLALYFSRFGTIVSSRVLVDLVTHSLRNYGFVKFATHESALAALTEMNDFRISPSHGLHVTWATHREDATE